MTMKTAVLVIGGIHIFRRALAILGIQRIPNGPYTVVHADVKIGTPNLACVPHVIYCAFDGYNNFF